MAKLESPWDANDDDIVLVNVVEQGNAADAAPLVNSASNGLAEHHRHNGVQNSASHSSDEILAEAVHNALNFDDYSSSQHHSAWNVMPPTEEQQEPIIVEAIPVFTPTNIPQQRTTEPPTQVHTGVYSRNPSSAAKDNNAMKQDSAATATTAKKKPAVGLWKMAGRKIRQNQAGKVLLDGIRDGIDGTKKTLGIGVGQIMINFEQVKVYQPNEVIKGFLRMELTEPIPARSLLVRLQGIRECTSIVVNPKTGVKGTKREKKVVHSTDYQISGQQIYPCDGNFPFQVVVPRLRPRMSNETKNTFVGSIISSVQMVNDAMKSPIEWSIYATLVIPGRLNMSSKSCRIHVGDDEQ